MELVKTSFDKLNAGGECLFRNDKHLVIHAIKIDHTTIIDYITRQRAFTGQYHEVWEIDPNQPKRI